MYRGRENPKKITSARYARGDVKKMEELYTVQDIARIIKCNVTYVHKLRKTGLLKFMKLGSYKCRVSTFLAFLDEYDGKDLDSLVQERQNEPI